MSASKLSEAYLGYCEASKIAHKASLLADNQATRYYAEAFKIFFLVLFHPLHQLPEFELERWVGKGGSNLRAGIDQYDFDSMHKGFKSLSLPADPFMFGTCSTGLLHFYGDIEAAKAGWRKQNHAWRKVAELVQRAEYKWSVYFFEGFLGGYTSVGDMLMIGEMDLLRENFKLTPAGLSLEDPLISKEWAGHLRQNPLMYQGEDGYCFCRMESILLVDRALGVLVEETALDADALRSWLPSPSELISIAVHEFQFTMFHAALHPAILCSKLYTRLGAWEDAAAVARGLLDIAPLGDGKGFGWPVMHRVEAWRLLGSCCGARGDSDGASQAFESAAREAHSVGYVFLEMMALKDMLLWVSGGGSREASCASTMLPGAIQGEGEGDVTTSLQARIDKLLASNLHASARTYQISKYDAVSVRVFVQTKSSDFGE